MFNLNFLYIHLCCLPFVPSLNTTEKRLVPYSSPIIYTHLLKAFSRQKWKYSSSQPFLISDTLASWWPTSIALFWTQSSKSMSVFKWELRTDHKTPDVVITLWAADNTLYAAARMLVAFCSPKAHCLILLVSTKSFRSSSTKLHPRHLAPVKINNIQQPFLIHRASFPHGAIRRWSTISPSWNSNDYLQSPLHP